MKFSIITPTYKRADKLIRAVNSLRNQTYTDWEMIIVNDSPAESDYLSFEQSINDSRIRYLKNEKNEGVNYTRNKALDAVSIHSDWTIFLDDDDYLAPDALETFCDLIRSYDNTNWFVTNKAYKNGTPTTNFPKPDKWYSYAWDYLILKKCKGDATHCIRTKEINEKRFLKNIKQAEEWFFFYQIGLKNKFYYHDHNSIIIGDYDEVSGLNLRKRNRKNEFKTILVIAYEGTINNIIYHPAFLVYLLMRLVRILIKNS